MSWDPSQLSTSAVMQVRLEIGDTDTSNELLTDSMISYRLGQHTNDVGLVVILCIEDILAKVSKEYDRSNVGMGASRSQIVTHYRDLLKEKTFRYYSGARATLRGASKSEQTTQELDTDWKPSQFELEQFDKSREG